MDPRSIPDIREALQALERYERSSAEFDDAQAFREALELLADHLEDEPESPHRAFIANVRMTHVRRMIERLGRLKNADDFVVLAHLAILTGAGRAETERLAAADPALAEAVRALRAQWPGELPG